MLSARFVQLARDAGALSVLPLALTTRAAVRSVRRASSPWRLRWSTRWRRSTRRRAPASHRTPRLALAAFQGREAEATPLIEAATRELAASRRGTGADDSFTGRPPCSTTAWAATRRRSPRPSRPPRPTLVVWRSTWGLVELIEAAARSGKPELAVDALGRLSQTTAASGTDWALGVEARSRALLTEGEAAEPLYRQAIEAARAGPASAWSSPAPTSCTANGCAASAAGSTRASSYAPPTSCSRSSAWKRSPSAPGSSSRRPASTPANGPSRRATT